MVHPYKQPAYRLEGEPPLWEVDHHTFVTGWARQNLEPFVVAIREGKDRAPTLRDGLLAQEVIEAASRAARSGRWEPVPAVG
jgi:predicted dehydrogenase